MLEDDSASFDRNRTSLDGFKVYVSVWDRQASLAVAHPYVDAKSGQYREEIHYVDDLESIGLKYQDVIDAVEEEGYIELSGCYPLDEKLTHAVFEHKAEILGLFEG